MKQKLFLLKPRLPNRKAVTIIEVLIVMAILGGVLSSLVLVLNTGYITSSISREKFELQENTRRALVWMVRDIRKTTASEIKANSPTAAHIKFRVYSGYSVPNPTWGNYVEYTYDSDTNILTRKDYATGVETYFYNIIQDPFSINQAWIDGSDNTLDVTVSSQGTARGSIVVNFSLSSEVRIRNE